MTPGSIPSQAHAIPDHPAGLLPAFMISLLAPLLMTAGITDTDLARCAAQQAIDAYRASCPDQLVSIAQIVGFALVSLDDLRLSMPNELSLSMKLKLRGNANALARCSRQATTTLDSQRSDATSAASLPAADAVTPRFVTHPLVVPHSVVLQSAAPQSGADDGARQAQVLTSLEDTRGLVQQAQAALARKKSAKPAIDRHCDLSWASAMTDVATEISTGLGQLPAAQRQTQLSRIGVLTKTANALGRGDVALRSQLLSSTSMRNS